MHRTGLTALAFAAAAVVVVAGCGGSGTTYGSGATSSKHTPASSGASSGASSVEMSSTSLGRVLTDGAGMTLYMYTPDPKGRSVCEGGCLAAWPALKGKPQAGPGVAPALIGSIKRSDGSPQGTYAGHPLYYYVQDSSSGDVTGQGLQNIWWVLDANGTPIRSTTSSGSGGY